MPSNHLIVRRLLLLLPSIFPSIRVFSSESVLHFRWPKFWSFSFSISLPLNVQDWFPLGWTGLVYLKSKGLFKSLLQHNSSNASVLWCSAFFIAQLSRLYMTTGKAWALTRWTFVGKVMPLLFNMLSRLVIAFLPRNKQPLISWLQWPSSVIVGLLWASYFIWPIICRVNCLFYESINCETLYACSITQLCLTLCHPLDCSLPGSSVHGVLQARVLE